ncbi:pyruvate dehydrogenase (acetyl-transferring) E1 component subunit alpha [Rhodococcus opacus]|nr:pyruvate dehydrogenase (acetyl-transferring) E1 component subunit alpha [Rhodococcus opacus]
MTALHIHPEPVLNFSPVDGRSQDRPIQMVTPTGELTTLCPSDGVDLELVMALHRDMARARRLDREALALQRQGELNLWLMSWGQEAAQVGSISALRSTDMVFPSYREHAAALVRGISPAELLSQWRGCSHAGWDPETYRFHLNSLVLGTQTLHATGYAAGVLLDGSDEVVTVYFGDGAASQGDVNEAFNWACAGHLPVLFFCQNNQWAISTPTAKQMGAPVHQRAAGFGMPAFHVDGNDALAVWSVTTQAAEHVRSGKGPVLIEARTYRRAGHSSSDDPGRYRTESENTRWAERDPLTRTEQLLRTSGIPDSYFEEIAEECDVLAAEVRTACRTIPEPDLTSTFEHTYSTPTPWSIMRGVSTMLVAPSLVADPETLPLGKALNAGLREALRKDSRVLIMGEDIGALGGVFRVTDGLQAEFGERRIVDTPLAESGIVGTAIGLALRGYRPVCEIQFDGFVYPGFDQIVSQLAKMRARSGGRINLPIVIRIPAGGGIGAVEHHSESNEAYFAHTAGLRVVSCANSHDAYHMIQQAIECDDPVIFLEPKRRYWEKSAVGPEPLAPLDRARVLRDGTDCTLVAHGPTVASALAAAEAAQLDGYSVGVVDLRSIAPLDLDILTSEARRTGRMVVVHEASTFLGIGAEIAAAVTEACFADLRAPVLRVGAYNLPYPPARVENEFLPDVDRILEAVDRSLDH